MSKNNYKIRQQSNVSNDSMISTHDIELLAYQMHEERGGTELENWLEAERVLKERHVPAEVK